MRPSYRFPSTEGVPLPHTNTTRHRIIRRRTPKVPRNTIPVYHPLLPHSESPRRHGDKHKTWTQRTVCCVIIDDSNRYFRIHDLQTMKYFRNYNANGHCLQIEIHTTKYQFGITELQTIIECKIYHEICCDYKFSRIPNLINALDYFGEIIDYNIFYQYLLNYFPVIDASITAMFVSNKEGYTSSVSQLLKAMNMYQNTPNKMGIRMSDRFINNWKELSIHKILNIDNLSYRVLMNTLRLIKIKKQTQIGAVSQKRFPGNFVFLIEFIYYRSWDDFRKLWKSVLHSRNYVHLFNILLNVTNEYLRKKDLECAVRHHDRYNMYKYKRIEDKHDIGNLTQQMIKRVAYRIFYDKQSLIGCNIYTRFVTIIEKYVHISTMLGQKSVIREFYGKLVDKYFEAHGTFHESISVLFGSYFNGIILKERYLQLNDSQKETFLWSISEMITNQKHRKYRKMYRFFKKETLKYIIKTVSRTDSVGHSFVAFVTAFKEILDAAKDRDILNQLYGYFIDECLFECEVDGSMWLLVLNVCDYKIILRKYKALDIFIQIELLKYLCRSILTYNRHIALKQKELIKFLLDNNRRIAVMIFDVWFKILMVEEKDWIMNTFLNGSLGFIELNQVLHTVSETILIANRHMSLMSVPQEYFHFINRHS